MHYCTLTLEMTAGLKRKMVALFFVATLTAAEDPPPLRITVTLVQVDAVVTDKSGRHLMDLKKEDFEIKQDGVSVPVSAFSFMPDDRQPAGPVIKSVIGPRVPLGPSAVKRTVAIVVDDLSLTFESVVRTRNSLKQFVTQRMQPGDFVAIVRTGGGVAHLEQFTTDKTLLLAAIDLMKWRFNGRTGLLPINPIEEKKGSENEPSSPQILEYNDRLPELGVLGTLEQVVGGMRRLPGRKSIVFLSEALRMDGRVAGAIDHLTDMANRAAVSIYAIDPGGLRAKGSSVEFEDSSSEEGGEQQSLAGAMLGGMPGGSEFRSQFGLETLAKRTGGLFYNNRNDIPECIRLSVDDQMGYYLLGYSPPEGTFGQDGAESKFHRITVKVSRPGVQVRWKTGFSGVTDANQPQPDVALTREQQLTEALASPFAETSLNVRLSSFYTNNSKQGPSVYSMLYFGANQLTFKKQENGMWHSSVDLVTSAYRGLKQPIQQRQRRENIVIPDDVYQRALKEGFQYNYSHPMPEPGTFLIRAVVRDAETGKIGSATQSLEVPDTRKGQLALSSIIITTAAAEFQARQEFKTEPWKEGGPARRRYLAGQAITYGFFVINPKLNRQKKTALVKELRLYANGKSVYMGKPGAMPSTDHDEPGRFMGGGYLQLGGALSPGEYVLQIVITDKLARKKKSQVAQWIDFEVLPKPGSGGPKTALLN